MQIPKSIPYSFQMKIFVCPILSQFRQVGHKIDVFCLGNLFITFFLCFKYGARRSGSVQNFFFGYFAPMLLKILTELGLKTIHIFSPLSSPRIYPKSVLKMGFLCNRKIIAKKMICFYSDPQSEGARTCSRIQWSATHISLCLL